MRLQARQAGRVMEPDLAHALMTVTGGRTVMKLRDVPISSLTTR